MIFACAKTVLSVECFVLRGMSRKSQVSSLKKEVLLRNTNRNFSFTKGVAEQRNPKLFTFHFSLFTFSGDSR